MEKGLQLKEFFYIPQFIDYARLLFLYFAIQHTDWRFCAWYTASYVLDIFDGMAARYFNQKSLLGYYLDMVIDRISSCVALHFAAVAVLSGLTIVPASLNTPVVYVLYSCLVMVEIIAHGVVCYFAEVLGIHQKHLGFDYLLVRLYLDSKALLFYGCASYEALVLALILNASDKESSLSAIWGTCVLLMLPGFIFRALANLCRLIACFTLDRSKPAVADSSSPSKKASKKKSSHVE